MFRDIRQKLGTAGFIISIVALVAALGGGAYAASNGLTGQQKKEVKSIAKAEAKKVATAGAPGPAGPAGPKGEVGANGTNGSNGAVGPSGTNGTNGKNGTNGTNGTTGFTATLPGGKTETGAWSFGLLPALPIPAWRQPISFSIPLAEPITSSGCTTVEAGPPTHVATTCHVHYINVSGKEVVEPTTGTFEEMNQTVCAGTAAVPTAPAGELCVYLARASGSQSSSSRITALNTEELEGTSSSGAMIKWAVEEESLAFGTWAVTAEEE